LPEQALPAPEQASSTFHLGGRPCLPQKLFPFNRRFVISH